MVGRQYGEQLFLGSGRFVYLLSPSMELWTATLPHRTQILYVADISMIVMQLEVRPGSVVIEAGTGSGSLSHGLARAAGMHGKVHTFEFNGQRAQLASAEFTANGLGERITCCHGDVCAANWSYEAHLARASADAVVFDLPQPWDAVRTVAPFMRPGGRLCTFSPCIEQVARTLDALRASGFTGMEVIETIVRTHEVRPTPTQHDAVAHAAVQAGKVRSLALDAGAEHQGCEHTDMVVNTAPSTRATSPEHEHPPKRRRSHPQGGGACVAAPDGDSVCAVHPSEATPLTPRSALPPPLVRTRPFADMRGHTGFLVFCTKHISG